MEVFIIFLLFSFLVGGAVILLFSFLHWLFSPKKKAQPLYNTSKEDAVIRVPICVSPKERKDLSEQSYINGLIGLSAIGVYRNGNTVSVDFYLKNLSSSIFSFQVVDAFYITSDGEQISGSTFELESVSSKDYMNSGVRIGTGGIVPHLKVKRTAYFYKGVSKFNYFDMLLIRVRVQNRMYFLSDYVFK